MKHETGDFMDVYTDYSVHYQIEGENGIDSIPADLTGDFDIDGWDGETMPSQFADYTENKECHGIEKKSGWFARLSAAGYSDCTEWMGPYDSEEDAVDAVCELYDCETPEYKTREILRQCRRELKRKQ